MCGHVGIAGKIGFQEEKMFKQMLHLDVLRGVHSTGVAAIGKSNDALVKQVGGPIDLFDMKTFDNALRPSNNVLIGHNRAATKGKVNKANAHPFDHGNIVGAHNGTLTKQSLLPDHNDFGTDSENIMHSLNVRGVDWTIKNLAGAFALVWYDRSDTTINFIRNKERPLCFAYSEDRKSLFWASEAWMITVAAHRCEVDVGKVYSLDTGKHMKVKIEPAFLSDAKPIYDIKVATKEMYVAPSYGKKSGKDNNNNKKFPNSRNSSLHDRTRNMINRKVRLYPLAKKKNVNGTMYIEAKSVAYGDVTFRIHTDWDSNLAKRLMELGKYFTAVAKKMSYEKGSPYLTVDLRSVEEVEGTPSLPYYEEDKTSDTDIVVGFDMEPLNKQEYESRVKNGCGNCASVPEFKDASGIEWLSKDTFLCPDCAGDEHLKKVIGLV